VTGAAIRAALLVLALAAALVRPASADERASVREVVDGRTLVLSDGRTLRLAGIDVPEASGERRALFEAARALVERLTRNRPLTITDAAPLPDRRGRLVAHARVDEVWVQGALIQAGLARFHPTPLNRARTTEMAALETAARYDNRGVWKTRLWTIVDADDTEALRRDAGAWRVVKGRVHRAEIRGGTAWIDLGEDWRTDTTIKIDKTAMRLFKKEKIDPLPPPGTEIRARGVIEDGAGPVIAVDLPEQIERP